MDESAFELFWENSKLNPTTVREFGARIAAYEGDGRPRQLDHPGPDLALPMPTDRLLKTMRERRSSRRWGNAPLSFKHLASLLAGLSSSPQGTRVYPSAGSTYALETYLLCHRVKGLEGTICHHNPDNHSVTVIGRLPGEEDYLGLLNLEIEREAPQLVVVLAAFSDRTTAKYGSRGGRFVLIEAGQAAQNVALRAAHERLAMVEIGGLPDDQVADLLDIRRFGGRVVLGLAVGR